jgi:hypothetical protein
VGSVNCPLRMRSFGLRSCLAWLAVTLGLAARWPRLTRVASAPCFAFNSIVITEVRCCFIVPPFELLTEGTSAVSVTALGTLQS